MSKRSFSSLQLEEPILGDSGATETRSGSASEQPAKVRDKDDALMRITHFSRQLTQKLRSMPCVYDEKGFRHLPQHIVLEILSYVLVNPEDHRHLRSGYKIFLSLLGRFSYDSTRTVRLIFRSLEINWYFDDVDHPIARCVWRQVRFLKVELIIFWHFDMWKSLRPTLVKLKEEKKLYQNLVIDVSVPNLERLNLGKVAQHVQRCKIAIFGLQHDLVKSKEILDSMTNLKEFDDYDIDMWLDLLPLKQLTKVITADIWEGSTLKKLLTCNNLRHLEIELADTVEPWFKLLVGFSQLASLKIGFTNLDFKDFAPHLPTNLHRLFLESYFFPIGLERLNDMHRLESVHIKVTCIIPHSQYGLAGADAQALLASVAAFTVPVHLNTHWCNEENMLLLMEFNATGKLKSLHIDDNHVIWNASAMRWIGLDAGAAALEQLSFGCAAKLYLDSLPVILDCPRLKRLGVPFFGEIRTDTNLIKAIEERGVEVFAEE